MKHEARVNELLSYFSEDSGIPIDSLHLIGINPDQISKSIDTLVLKGTSYTNAIRYIKDVWKKSNPDNNTPATDNEMELMGFVISETGWHHIKSDVKVSFDEQKRLPFKSVEKLVIDALIEKK